MPARILVVDDTPANVKLIVARLAGDYYQVTTAASGQAALDQVAAEKPDLILLDIQMPDMDGFEACRRLKADPATADIPVVILTALSDSADRVRGLTLGADDFLSKPINPVALMARIRSLLRTKLLMDEWRLRAATTNQLAALPIAPALAALSVAGQRILLIGCDRADTASIEQQLAAREIIVAAAADLPAAEAMLAGQSFDVVLIELGSPIAPGDAAGHDGLLVCSALRSKATTRQIPILLLADADAIDRVAKGLDLGANDYLNRPIEPEELFARVRTQLRHKRGYEMLREGLAATLQAALVDPLTQAFNRRYLDAHMPRYIQQAIDGGKSLSVQMIDIDHFKKINDRYMHAGGDAVLREVARRILANIRPSDFFVRMGGEEFAVVMPDTQPSIGHLVAERLRLAVSAEPIAVPDEAEPVAVTVSIGLATCDMTPGSVAADLAAPLFARADAALYQAKNNGRNRVEIAPVG